MVDSLWSIGYGNEWLEKALDISYYLQKCYFGWSENRTQEIHLPQITNSINEQHQKHTYFLPQLSYRHRPRIQTLVQFQHRRPLET